MKRYWPIFFLFTILIFQFYLFSWNKNQTITLATNKISVTPPPPNFCDKALLYPFSSIKEQHATDVFLESTNSPQNIREWYHHTFIAHQLHTTSDVVTTNNTTDTYLLSAEKGLQQTTVIIGKGARETTTTIFIREVCK